MSILTFNDDDVVDDDDVDDVAVSCTTKMNENEIALQRVSS